MVLSGEEQRRWHELEAELAREPQLVSLANRLATGGSRAALSRMAPLLWFGGVVLGLLITIIGWIGNDSVVGTAGVAVMVASVVFGGMTLVMIGITSMRRPARG